jgi:hypothetical protein
VAPAQVRVEPIDQVDAVLQLAQRHVAQGRAQGAPDVAGGRLGGAELVVDGLHPAVQQGAHRGRQVGLPLGVDLVDQSTAVPLGLRTISADLPPEVGLPAGERVLARYTRARKPLRGVSIEPFTIGPE